MKKIYVPFTIAIFLLLNFVVSYSQSACDSCSISPCNPANISPDIPPFPGGWTCEPLTEITVTMPDGIICKACVAFCWRQPYLTSPRYQLYLCSFCISNSCQSPAFWALTWTEKEKIIAESIITNNPGNIFTYIPDCPINNTEVEVFWSRCWDGINTCAGSNSWCQKVYSICMSNGVIIHTFLYAQSSPGINCAPPCTNIDPCY